MSIPFTAWLFLVPALGAWGLYAGGSVARPVAVLAVASVAGGLVAGGALGGLRWRIAFGAAFCATAWVPLLLLSGLPALGGRESAGAIAVALVPGFALAHATLGAAGLAFGGAGWRGACRGGLVFGVAGAVGGAAASAAAGLAPGAGGLAGFAVQSLGGGTALLLPAAAGGWWLGGRQDPRARTGPTRPGWIQNATDTRGTMVA